jgi:LysM repeat protein
MKLKLIFYFFLILGFLSFSQTNPDRFIVHKVKKKETLYSLSKMYNISIETIKDYNPLIDKIGLKRKMKLQIPFFKNVHILKDKPKLVNYKKHIVKPKETKWRLAYEYGLKISDLEKINPEIVSGLKIGQQILLPTGKDKIINDFENELNYYQVKSNENISLISKKIGISTDSLIAYNPGLINNQPEEETIIKIPNLFSGNFDIKNGLLSERISLKDSFFSNNYLQLVCFLPFKIREIEFDSIEKTKNKLSKRNLHTISTDFYFGMEMARDFCDSLGIKTKIKVIDTQNDLSIINEKISFVNWKAINAIIGPLIPKNFEFFSKNFKISDIPIISPLSTKEIDGDKNSFQSVGRLKRLRKVMMNYIKNEIDSTQNIVIITDSINLKVADEFKKLFSKAHFVESEKGGFVVPELIDSLLVDSLKNQVIFESQNLGLTANVTSLLNSQVGKDRDVQLFSSLRTTIYDDVNISRKHLGNIKFTYLNDNFPRETTERLKFKNKFLKKYGGYPTKESYRGFDVTLDVILRLAYQNKIYSDKIEETNYIENVFKYLPDKAGGYSNFGFYILQNKDYDIIEIKK